MKIEITRQADYVRCNLDNLDRLIDNLNKKESISLLEVYKSLNIILKAQQRLLSKPDLRVIRG